MTIALEPSAAEINVGMGSKYFYCRQIFTQGHSDLILNTKPIKSSSHIMTSLLSLCIIKNIHKISN